MPGHVLILGGTGRFGRHTAEAFWNAGWTVSLFDRATDTLPKAAAKADVIVYGWNPPYAQWTAQVPGQVQTVITAARAANATVLLPGNVYVFGPDAPPAFGPDTPHGATNPLGQIRVDMETTFRKSGVQTIVLRCGDFLDTEASGNWFDKIMAPRLSKGRLTYPGPLDVPHAWAYLPDVARAAVALAEQRQTLPKFADIPFSGFTLTGRQMGAALAQTLGYDIAVKPMSWAPLYGLAPFWKTARHLIEMRYLWSKPHNLETAPLATCLPTFRPTPVTEALKMAARPCLPVQKTCPPGTMARA